MDLLREREEVGASLETLAEYAEVDSQELADWERTGEVPRGARARVRWALWAVRRDAALTVSGLPECDAQAIQGDIDLEALQAHLKDCRRCAARLSYVEEHVGPMPPLTAGMLMRTLALLGHLQGWQRAATAGAMLLLAMAGIGVVILLGLGLIKLELSHILQALGLLVVLVIGGGAGGIAYYFAEPLRRRGALWHYVAAILTVYGYMLGVFGVLALGAAVLGWEAIDPELGDMMADPAGWIIAAILGVFFGIVLGRAIRTGSSKHRNGA